MTVVHRICIVLSVGALVLGAAALAQQDHGDHVHPAVAAGSEILPPLGEHGWHHTVIEVTATEEGFVPAAFSVRQGEPFIVVFSNRTEVEHHFHIMALEPAELSWFMVTATDLDQFDVGSLFAAERAKDHICDSVTGICRLGINVHLHANPMSFDAIMFTAPTAGTFTVECPLHPDMQATLVVEER